ncbi:MAG: NAD(+) diphosphatase [Actinomycetota bacterium]|nr:NAD(+) diphosphatase [Actinomycetota bacterium]
MLDRAGAHRTDAAWLAARRADPGARAVVVTSAGVLMAGDEPAFVALDALAGAPELVLLGVDGAGSAIFAADIEGPFAAGETRSLRDVAPRLAQADGGLLAQAAGLLNWHRRHRFCANCGAPTAMAEAGHVRACPVCAAEHHPRTDPVVIMLVARDDRVLLGRQATWPQGRYSALAGFVEPGESLEEAVAREVGEEAGVRVADVRYRSSQPWPFPNSLMLGFSARWAGGEPAVRDGELEDVGWFTREAIVGGDVLLPPPTAIARRLIDEWLGDDEAPDAAGGLAV